MLSDDLIEQIARNSQAFSAWDLSWQNLDDDDMKALATALRTNTTLRSLNLQGTRITTQGLIFLAAALYKNTGLISLQLGFNPLIKREGIFALCRALKKNVSLLALDIFMIDLDEPSKQALSNALLHNLTLQRLEVSSQYHPLFQHLLVRNNALTSKPKLPVTREWESSENSSESNSEASSSSETSVLHFIYVDDEEEPALETSPRLNAKTFDETKIDTTYKQYKSPEEIKIEQDFLIRIWIDKYRYFQTPIPTDFNQRQNLLEQALINATSAGGIKDVQKLIPMVKNINAAQGPLQRTALHHAVLHANQNGDSRCFYALKLAGASLLIQDKKGKSPAALWDLRKYPNHEVRGYLPKVSSKSVCALM